MSVATYLLVMMIGMFYIFDVFDPKPVTLVIGQGWQYLWQWMMATGGPLGITGMLMRKDLEDGLLMECVGSGFSFLGMYVYTVCLIDVVGFHSLVWTLLAVIGLGCAWRCGQSYQDRNKAMEIANSAEDMLRREA